MKKIWKKKDIKVDEFAFTLNDAKKGGRIDQIFAEWVNMNQNAGIKKEDLQAVTCWAVGNFLKKETGVDCTFNPGEVIITEMEVGKDNFGEAVIYVYGFILNKYDNTLCRFMYDYIKAVLEQSGYMNLEVFKKKD